MKPWFAARRVDDFARSLNESGITWSVFRSFAQAIAEDPDCSTANPMFSVLEQPGIGSYLVPGSPLSFGACDREPPTRAPLLGEHTDAILHEIGYSDSEIGALHDAKAVAGPAR